jgi:hypothetical protein
MLKRKHILASMIYFDSDISKSTNTVVYFDWKTVIYIYACENVAQNLCNSNNTAPSIGIIRVTIYAAKVQLILTYMIYFLSTPHIYT